MDNLTNPACLAAFIAASEDADYNLRHSVEVDGEPEFDDSFAAEAFDGFCLAWEADRIEALAAQLAAQRAIVAADDKYRRLESKATDVMDLVAASRVCRERREAAKLIDKEAGE